jgi:chromosome segregation ATPase
MAAPTKIIESDVIKAANELNRQSKNITGSALRKISGVGRPENVFAVYEQLLEDGKITAVEKNSAVSEVVEVRDLPVEVQQSLDDAVSSLKNVVMHCNEIAHNTVESRLSSAINKANEKELLAAEDMQKSEIDLTNAFNEIEQLKEESQAEIELLSEKNGELVKEISETKSELRSYHKSNSELEGKNVDLLIKLEAKTEQCTTAEQESLVQATRTEEANKQLVTAENVNADLNGKLDATKDLNAQYQADIATLKAKLEDALLSKDEAKAETKSQTIIANNAAAEAAKSNAETVAAKEQVTALKDSEALLHKQLEQQAVTINEDKTKIETLESDLKNEQAKSKKKES